MTLDFLLLATVVVYSCFTRYLSDHAFLAMRGRQNTVQKFSWLSATVSPLLVSWNFSYELELGTPVARAAVVLLRYYWSRELQFCARALCPGKR